MVKKSLLTIVKMLVILIGAAILGTLLLCLSYYLPTGRIKQNVEKSLEQIVREGDHFSRFPALKFTTQDNYSDANYMNAAMVDAKAKGIFTGLYGIEYENELMPISADSPVTVLNNVFQENSELTYREYGRRFWNGYVIPVKLLLLFFSYGQIRYINLFLEISLLFIMGLLLHRQGLTKYIIPIVLSYLLLGPVPMSASMAFSGFMYCSYVPCVIILLFNDRLKEKDRYPLFFLIVGICVAFFNMNYIQLITFSYSFVFYCILNDFPKTVRNTLRTFGVFFGGWLIGFCGMYIMKWIVYEVCTGQPLISDMIFRTIYRTSATAYYTGPSISRLFSLGKNYYYVLINIPWLVIEIIFIALTIHAYKRSVLDFGGTKSAHRYAPMTVLIGLMIVIVSLRYLIFANHVYVHAWVTFRIADAIILTTNAVLVNITYYSRSVDFNIAISDCVVGITACNGSTYDFCKEYVSKLPRDFQIEITTEDIQAEYERLDRTVQKEEANPDAYTEAYMETLALYRKLSTKLLDYDTLLFHGSAIAVDGEAYLFAALSGTGKSTHARLWREQFGDRAVMINDDKPLLKITNEGVIVYGTPWNGKHRLGTNTSVPLKAIAFLERAEENHISKIDKRSALPMLLQQSFRPCDAVNLAKAMKLIDRLGSKVSLYRLKCNMEPEAAMVSYAGMNSEEINYEIKQ